MADVVGQVLKQLGITCYILIQVPVVNGMAEEALMFSGGLAANEVENMLIETAVVMSNHNREESK